MIQCQRCNEPMTANKLKCTKCGTWAVETVHNERGSTIMLADVKSADIDRIHSGPWDYIFGQSYNLETGEISDSGIVRTSANLIGGSPGAGKSTLFLQIAAGIIQSEGREIVYLHPEEPDTQIKARADRMKIPLETQRMMRMVPIMSGAAPSISELLQRFNPAAMFLDSIQGMCGEDELMCVKVCETIKGFCMTNHCPAIISSHVTKGGDLAGLEKLQHTVDATYTFFPDEADGGSSVEDNSLRVLHVEKNRNGKAFINQKYLMTQTGLILITDEELEAADDEDEEDYDD